MLSGVAEVFDTAKHALQIELATSGYVVEFEFPAPGAATAVRTDGATFHRVP